ncbi:hypothetical protein CRG98_000602 [Punica granatum]|uniref:Uncharacterized protein n=1 Tax=Punica granatum TaxID=22663 RepID=A0A2I0LE49_PUNGR|nr:hypothetical protein CRG98_000602 [Punica granatum]
MGPSPYKPNENLIWYQSGLRFRMSTRVCAWTHTTLGPICPNAAKSAPRVSVSPRSSTEDEPGSRSIVEGGGSRDKLGMIFLPISLDLAGVLCTLWRWQRALNSPVSHLQTALSNWVIRSISSQAPPQPHCNIRVHTRCVTVHTPKPPIILFNVYHLIFESQMHFANPGSKKRGRSSRPPIGDPDPTTEVTDTRRGCQKPRWWGRGHRLVALALESIGISSSRSRSIQGQGPPISDLDPTSMVAGILCGCMRHR